MKRTTILTASLLALLTAPAFADDAMTNPNDQVSYSVSSDEAPVSVQPVVVQTEPERPTVSTVTGGNGVFSPSEDVRTYGGDDKVIAPASVKTNVKTTTSERVVKPAKNIAR